MGDKVACLLSFSAVFVTQPDGCREKRRASEHHSSLAQKEETFHGGKEKKKGFWEGVALLGRCA